MHIKQNYEEYTAYIHRVLIGDLYDALKHFKITRIGDLSEGDFIAISVNCMDIEFISRSETLTFQIGDKYEELMEYIKEVFLYTANKK